MEDERADRNDDDDSDPALDEPDRLIRLADPIRGQVIADAGSEVAQETYRRIMSSSSPAPARQLDGLWRGRVRTDRGLTGDGAS